MKYEEMSNADITAKLRNYENEYNAIKIKVAKMVDRLKELDTEYILANKELNKRRGGIVDGRIIA